MTNDDRRCSVGARERQKDPVCALSLVLTSGKVPLEKTLHDRVSGMASGANSGGDEDRF